jgi:hypothetical protein
LAELTDDKLMLMPEVVRTTEGWSGRRSGAPGWNNSTVLTLELVFKGCANAVQDASGLELD